jgi:menaquinone-9 beta-reductase
LGATPFKTDVLVVGGGPAGLAAAIAARLKGFDVVVADAARPPIDKACGEGLMPDSIAALRRLGIAIGPDHGFPIRGIRFLGDDASTEASFPSGFGFGMRRTRLHQMLADRAAELGVTLHWGALVADVSSDLPCRWIVGADGQHSRARRAAGLDSAWRKSMRYGFRRHYRIAPWTDYIEVHWGPGFQVYVTPIARDEICLALLCRDRRLRMDDALPHFEQLRRRLAGIACSTAERGALTGSRRLRRVYRDRTVLIGDASGSVDAITGEGLCLAFRQAFALADAMRSGDLAAYRSEHRLILRRPMLMGDLMLSLDRCSWLRRPVLRALAWEPAIFAKLLAVHVGMPSPAVVES